MCLHYTYTLPVAVSSNRYNLLPNVPCPLVFQPFVTLPLHLMLQRPTVLPCFLPFHHHCGLYVLCLDICCQPPQGSGISTQTPKKQIPCLPPETALISSVFFNRRCRKPHQTDLKPVPACPQDPTPASAPPSPAASHHLPS